MKFTHLFHPAALFFVASIASAQTTTWVGQNPPDPNRLSSWTDGTNWSTGTVPNGPTAVAQVDQAFYSSGGLIARDKLQILNSAVTLDGLQYGLSVPYYYYYPYLNVPSITVGGTGTGDYGSLEFVGTGISSPNTLGYYYPGPNLRLRNGTLLFSNNAGISVSTTIDASSGTNRIWFRDSSIANYLNITLNTGSRLDFTNRAKLTYGSLSFYGGHIAFADQSSLLNSSLYVYGPGFISFSGQSMVISPYIYFNRPGLINDSIVRFSGNAYVEGGSVYSSGSSGVVEFTDQAVANGFSISYVRQLDVTGATTGTGTTGRQRAVVNTPAATSVVADDARTLYLGFVNVTDLLLGSNSVNLTGGYLTYISDVGGAYLSSAGSNLTGGSIIKSGYGTLSLGYTNAVSPYAVPLTINGGNVFTYRQKLGPVAVNPGGGLILGSGSAASIVNSGLIALTNQTYSVTGDYTQTGTGTLSAYVPYSGFGVPHLDITGQASLAGTLQTSGSGFFVGSRRYSILKAGSITGRFDTAPNINLSPMLSVGVEYTGNEVFFAYTQRPFVNAGATPSQQALGAHLDATLANATGAHYNVIYNLNTMQDTVLIAAGLGELAPDRYAVLNEQGFATAAARQAAIDRRLAALRSTPASAKGFTVFVEGGQLQNKFAALDGLPEVAMKSSGSLAGAAWRQGRWTVGASVAQDRTSADLDGLGSQARIRSTTPGLFAQYDAGRFFVQAAASQSDDDYTLLRDSGIGYRPSRVSAKVNGSRTDLSLTAGTTLKGKDWNVTSYAGILSSLVRLDNFAETRASGNTGTELAFRHWSVGSQRTRAGFDLTRVTTRGRAIPHVSVAWLHELEKERGLSTGLVGAGGAMYRAPGRPAETDLLQASLGLDWRINRQASFSLNAGLARGRNSATTSDLSAGFRWEF